MLTFSFSDDALKKDYSHTTIDVVVSGKSERESPEAFVKAAVEYLDGTIYAGDECSYDHIGFSLREKAYEGIVRDLLTHLGYHINIHISDIKRTFRIVLKDPYYMREEYIAETDGEWIMLIWSVRD